MVIKLIALTSLASASAAAKNMDANFLRAMNSGMDNQKTTKLDFLREMNGHTRRRTISESKQFNAELHGITKSSALLRKKMIEKSIVSKIPGGGGDVVNVASSSNIDIDGDVTSSSAKIEDHDTRKLQFSSSSGYKYNSNKDGSDDYFEFDNQFGFDVSQYSVSYHRCASVKQFEEGAFSTKQFAVFRFCPEQTCEGFQVR